jgi:hypothetical protein
MAQKNKDLLTRLADRGEQVVGRITDLPGAKTLVDRTAALTKSIDEMQKRLRSLDPLEKRVTSLEGKGSAKRAAPKRTATRRRPPSSS